MRRRTLAIVFSAVAAVVLTLAFVPGADAGAVVDAGWWDRNNGAPLGGAGPPPDGALRVQQDVNGPSAVAAVRYVLSDDEINPVLQLRVTGAPVSGNAGFLACRPAGDWSGADGGPWAERPQADCGAGRAGGSASADGTVVSFDVRNLVVGGVLDVVIAPAPTASDPVRNSFTTDFAAPTDTDVATARRAPTTTTTTAPPTTSTPPTTRAPSASPSTTQAFVVPTSSPTTKPTASPATTDPTPTSTTPGPTTTQPAERAAPAADGGDGRDGAGRKPFALLIAAAIVGLGAYLWNSERTSPTVPDGEVIGGLGAFRRPREQAAPDIS